MTSRSMAFKSELRDIRTRHAREHGHPVIVVRSLVSTAESASSFGGLLYGIRPLQLHEIALLLQRLDNAEIEIVVGVAAADVCSDRLELGEHVLGAFERGRCIARHQALEVGVGGR